LTGFGITSQQEAEQPGDPEAEDLAQQLADLERSDRAGSRGLTKVASVVETLDELVTWPMRP